MIAVPILFQRLLDMHGIDVTALALELDAPGPVRSRRWPAGEQGRRPLASLNDDFPRFKGQMANGLLRIDAMRLREDCAFIARVRVTRLTIPRPELPDTVIAALPGRRLAQLLDHPAVDHETTILSFTEEIGWKGRRDLAMELDMPRVGMVQRVAVATARTAEPVDLARLIARTHTAIAGAPVMQPAMRFDPRSWEAALDGRYGMVGLTCDAADHPVMVRFPYDPDRVHGIGRGGFEAWFDRGSYCWRVPARDASLDSLSEFLREHADIVIAPDGSLHLLRRD